MPTKTFTPPPEVLAYPDSPWPVFARMGWVAADWDDLDNLDAWDGVTLGEHLCVRVWLRNPPAKFLSPITPPQVRLTFPRYGQRFPRVLNAYAAGASPRFVAAVLAAQGHGDPITAWTCTQKAGLSEPDATGWATTGYLFTSADTTRLTNVRIMAGRFAYWTDQFGPTAWLYVLAGITFAEAVALKKAGTPISSGQLQVMAALNGHTVPSPT